MKRFKLCRHIINDLPLNSENKKWNSFVSHFRYYDSELRKIDMSKGSSTAGGGNYTKELRPIKDILLDKYIKIYYLDFNIDNELRKCISETYGFNSYVLSFHVNRLGDTIKIELATAAINTKKAFERLIKTLKK